MKRTLLHHEALHSPASSRRQRPRPPSPPVHIALPPEVWDVVFHHLREHFSTLVICSTVCTRWKTLALSHVKEYHAGYGAFSRLPQMLHFFRTRCSALRKLDLRGCVRLHDDMLKEFPPSLRDLNLRECRSITDRGMTHLSASCPHLESLDLSQPYPSKSRWLGPRIFDAGLSSLPNTLKELILWPCEDNLTGESLRHLSALEKLECASYDLQTEWLPASLKHLKCVTDFFGRLPSALHTLSIRYSSKSRMLEFAEELPSSLCVLAMQFHHLERGSGAMLPEGLEELRISNKSSACPPHIHVPRSVKRLYVHAPMMADEHVASILHQGLEKLCLSRCAVSDHLLRSLPHTLKHLRLDTVQRVTFRGILWLHRSNPDVSFTLNRCPLLHSAAIAHIVSEAPGIYITRTVEG